MKSLFNLQELRNKVKRYKISDLSIEPKNKMDYPLLFFISDIISYGWYIRHNIIYNDVKECNNVLIKD